VRFKNSQTGTEQTVTLVSGEEADPQDGKISVTSPVGKGLLGHEEGDVVEVNVPAGDIELEILEISRAAASVEE
jgi:transcription elongation factor GreA